MPDLEPTPSAVALADLLHKGVSALRAHAGRAGYPQDYLEDAFKAAFDRAPDINDPHDAALAEALLWNLEALETGNKVGKS